MAPPRALNQSLFLVWTVTDQMFDSQSTWSIRSWLGFRGPFVQRIYSLSRSTSPRYGMGMKEDQELNTRIGAMLIIFFVSLFASSFPSLSKRIAVLRIPRIVFFIGKHFGTGVILSTAFTHLLQDAFESLRHPEVLAKWRFGDFVGLMVLASLVSIFLVEYLSTSYVDRLHSYSSPPASPRYPSVDSRPEGAIVSASEGIGCDHTSIKITSEENQDDHGVSDLHERTPLIHSPKPSTRPPSPLRTQTFAYGTAGCHRHSRDSVSVFFAGHHRHESRGRHDDHHRVPKIAVIYGPEEFGQGRSVGVGHVHERGGFNGHMHVHGDEFDEPDTDETIAVQDSHESAVQVGKKRQIVGILVLQMGIMLHSLVIGLTLAITSGADFTSLLTAIIFHQLFEGLSLGIRIASLPPPEISNGKYIPGLKSTLALLFAVTTPIGIVMGLLIFTRSSVDELHMKLTQGLMAAISAGMLIYAACVEMLAGDFVMDPTLWRSGWLKQALALGSLLVGSIAMALVA